MSVMRTISRWTFVAVALPTLIGCAGNRSWNPPIILKPSHRILFIGNSYTFYNGGLDRILTEIAQQRGKQIVCLSSTSAGKSLQWHWNHGKARSLIANTHADWVVLQDYSLQPLNKRAEMDEYIRKFDVEIKRVGAKTALYMTWARQNQPQNQQTITDAYSTVGRTINAAVVPCGIAWQRVARERPDIKLYRGDGSHPTAEGSYLNACLFYAALLNDNPRGLTPLTIDEEGPSSRKLPDEVTDYLQRIAWETMEENIHFDTKSAVAN